MLLPAEAFKYDVKIADPRNKSPAYKVECCAPLVPVTVTEFDTEEKAPIKASVFDA